MGWTPPLDGTNVPAELTAPLIGSHDSLYILDGVGRMSVLSPSHRTVRTVLMSGPRIWPYDAAVRQDSVVSVVE